MELAIHQYVHFKGNGLAITNARFKGNELAFTKRPFLRQRTCLQVSRLPGTGEMSVNRATDSLIIVHIKGHGQQPGYSPFLRQRTISLRGFVCLMVQTNLYLPLQINIITK